MLEAVALGVKQVGEPDGLDIEEGLSNITVEIVTKTTHTVQLMKLREWRDSNSGRTPQEIARKVRTRQVKGLLLPPMVLRNSRLTVS